MKNIIAISTISIIGATLADAEVIDITSGRTEVAGGNVANADGYKVTNGQLFLNAWSHTSETFNCAIELAGEGHKNGETNNENQCALRLHEGAVVAGALTISANTRIWSSTTANTISGTVSQTGGDTSTICGNGTNTAASIAELKFSGSNISLKNVSLEKSASVTFASTATNILLTSVSLASGASGTQLKFEEGAKISLAEGQVLSLAADTLTFGLTTISSSTSDLKSTLSKYFTGTAISSINYSGNTLTVTAIPEPSAFGLLAGLGALALVASRRRRKTK